MVHMCVSVLCQDRVDKSSPKNYQHCEAVDGHYPEAIKQEERRRNLGSSVSLLTFLSAEPARQEV